MLTCFALTSFDWRLTEEEGKREGGEIVGEMSNDKKKPAKRMARIEKLFVRKKMGYPLSVLNKNSTLKKTLLSNPKKNYASSGRVFSPHSFALSRRSDRRTDS